MKTKLLRFSVFMWSLLALITGDVYKRQVIDILILLLNAEYCSLTRTVAGSEQHMTSERWERLSAVEVPFTLYLLISVLVIDTAAPCLLYTSQIQRVKYHKNTGYVAR